MKQEDDKTYLDHRAEERFSLGNQQVFTASTWTLMVAALVGYILFEMFFEKNSSDASVGE